MEHIKGSLSRYVEFGIEPGSFLMAVLTNDLVGAVGRADVENIKRIPEIVRYVYNHLPSGCWGSNEIVEEYIKSVKNRK